MVSFTGAVALVLSFTHVAAFAPNAKVCPRTVSDGRRSRWSLPLALPTVEGAGSLSGVVRMRQIEQLVFWVLTFASSRYGHSLL